jgi:hypothetical protein
MSQLVLFVFPRTALPPASPVNKFRMSHLQQESRNTEDSGQTGTRTRDGRRCTASEGRAGSAGGGRMRRGSGAGLGRSRRAGTDRSSWNSRGSRAGDRSVHILQRHRSANFSSTQEKTYQDLQTVTVDDSRERVTVAPGMVSVVGYVSQVSPDGRAIQSFASVNIQQ